MKIWFAEEKRPYTIRAFSERYLICTKPFAPQKTVIYTVVDLIEQIRGTENLIFGAGAESDEDCAAMLLRIKRGETEISHRNRIPLNIIKQEIDLCQSHRMKKRVTELIASTT